MRIGIIGDAHVSRYLKGGIDSALFTGTLAATAIVGGQLTREAPYHTIMLDAISPLPTYRAVSKLIAGAFELVAKRLWPEWT